MSSRIDLPAVDDRLVAPQSGYEIDDGWLVRVPPADEPHATMHAKLAALLEVHVGDDFDVALAMLTRISEHSDRAPDASVYPRARDPQTGGRQIEQLAFEIVTTEALSHAARKAAELTGRGVRRVFAIDVGRLRAFEWSRELGTWSLMDPAGAIDDPALAVTLPLAALVGGMELDDAMAHALIAKRNPVIMAAIADARAEGWAEGWAKGWAEGWAAGRAEAILIVLAQRGFEPRPDERERILGERDLAVLERWLECAVTCVNVADVFTAP